MEATIRRCPACGVKNRIPTNRQHLQAKCGRCGHTLEGCGNGQVLELDDGSFDQVLGKAALPVIVDFFSPACGPCRMLAPVINSLALKYAGRVVIAKYDTSRSQLTASRFQIKGVPTLLFFRQGRVVDQVVGAAPQAEIEQRLNSLIAES